MHNQFWHGLFHLLSKKEQITCDKRWNEYKLHQKYHAYLWILKYFYKNSIVFDFQFEQGSSLYLVVKLYIKVLKNWLNEIFRSRRSLKNKGIARIPNFKVDFLSAYYLKINGRMIAYLYF